MEVHWRSIECRATSHQQNAQLLLFEPKASRQGRREDHVLAQMDHEVRAHLTGVRDVAGAEQCQTRALDRAGCEHYERATIRIARNRAAEIDEATAGID